MFAALLLSSLVLGGISPVFAVFNFSVNAEPETKFAFPGQTVTYSVTVTLLSAPAGVVQLLISPLPPELNGLSFWFSPSASGTPTFSRTLYVSVSSGKAPGTYTIPVAGFNPTTGYRTDYVQLVVLSSAAITDWALSNPTMTPTAPKVGDSVVFSVLLSALSTNRPYPQNVRIGAYFDGVFLGTVPVSYTGPTGYPALLSTANAPWTATEGPHTVVMIVDPSPYAYDDPNRYSNQVSMSFSVSAAPPPFDFSVSASPSTQKVTAGESTSYVIVVSLLNGPSQAVSLSLAGLPTGATHSFNPPASNPTFQSTLTVSTIKSAAPGTYTVTLTASGGGLTRTATLSLEVEAAPEEDFVITVSPTSSEIEQGEAATHLVTINPMAGFKSAVDLSASGLPTGATATFSSTRLTPGGSSTLTIKTTRNTPAGSYALTVAASGGGKTHDATVALNIKQGKPPTIFETIGEYSLIIIGVLVALVLAMVVLMFLRRKPSPPSLPPTLPPMPPKVGTVFCASCGTQIPGEVQFCPKCGAKRVVV
jgi:hypothetical protein